MAVNTVSGKQGWTIPYSVIVDGAADHATVANDTFFVDLSDNQIRYKNVSGDILEIFSAASAPNFATDDLTLATNRTHSINGNSLTFDSGSSAGQFKVLHSVQNGTPFRIETYPAGGTGETPFFQIGSNGEALMMSRHSGAAFNILQNNNAANSIFQVGAIGGGTWADYSGGGIKMGNATGTEFPFHLSNGELFLGTLNGTNVHKLRWGGGTQTSWLMAQGVNSDNQFIIGGNAIVGNEEISLQGDTFVQGAFAQGVSTSIALDNILSANTFGLFVDGSVLKGRVKVGAAAPVDVVIGGGTDSNISTTDITFSNSRSHDLGNNELSFVNGKVGIGTATIDASTAFHVEASEPGSSAFITLKNTDNGANSSTGIRFLGPNGTSNGFIGISSDNVSNQDYYRDTLYFQSTAGRGTTFVNTENADFTFYAQGYNSQDEMFSFGIDSGSSSSYFNYGSTNGAGVYYEMARQEVQLTNVPAGAERSEMRWLTSDAGTLSEKMVLDHTGNLEIHGRLKFKGDASFSSPALSNAFKFYQGGDLDNDLIFRIDKDTDHSVRVTFSGTNNANEAFDQFRITSIPSSVVDGAEGSAIDFEVMDAGTMQKRMALDSTGNLSIDGQIKIEGGNPGDGKYLKSDANGLASWVDIPLFGKFSLRDANGQPTYYSTMQAAIDAASLGQTVEMHSDVVETGAVTITLKNDIHINGNGHTYTLDNVTDTVAFEVSPGLAAKVKLSNIRIKRINGGNSSKALVLSSLQEVLGYSTYIYSSNGNTVQTSGSAVVKGVYAENDSNYSAFHVQAGTIEDCTGISNGTGTGIFRPLKATNCIAYSSGSFAFELQQFGEAINVTSKSDGGDAFYTTQQGKYINCHGYSTAGHAFNCAGEFEGCTGKSTSGYGLRSTGWITIVNNCSFHSTVQASCTSTQGITATNTTFLSDAGEGASFSTSGTFVGCYFESKYDNVAGHACSVNHQSTFNFFNCSFVVKNTGAYCLDNAAGNNAMTSYYANCVFKGAATPVHAFISQGITNAADSQGNITY